MIGFQDHLRACLNKSFISAASGRFLEANRWKALFGTGRISLPAGGAISSMSPGTAPAEGVMGRMAADLIRLKPSVLVDGIPNQGVNGREEHFHSRVRITMGVTRQEMVAMEVICQAIFRPPSRRSRSFFLRA